MEPLEEERSGYKRLRDESLEMTEELERKWERKGRPSRFRDVYDRQRYIEEQIVQYAFMESFIYRKPEEDKKILAHFNDEMVKNFTDYHKRFC